MPKNFTAPHLKFDHVPRDDELVWLLGEHFCMGSVQIDDTTATLSGRPPLIPLKFVIPWMLLTAAGIIAMIWLMPGWSNGPFDRREARSFTALLVAVLPLMLGGLVLANHFLKVKGNFFRADKAAEWFELCPKRRKFSAEQIVAFTELTRYHHHGTVLLGEWIRQFGVLVRDDQQMIIHYPIALESVATPRKATLAERLAELFSVPLRRIDLDRAQSRALRDG